MKDNEIVKMIFVINGKYVVSTKEYTMQEFKKIKNNLKSPSFLDSSFKKYIKEKGILIDDKLSYICPDCANMLKCPKVMDHDKKPLKAYPFITNGAQIICVNEYERAEYKLALSEYRKRLDAGDETVLKDLGILEKLNSNGFYVPSISVFGCSNYVDDKKLASQSRALDREIKKQDKARAFVDGEPLIDEKALEEELSRDPANVLRKKKKDGKTPKIPNLSDFFGN